MIATLFIYLIILSIVYGLFLFIRKSYLSVLFCFVCCIMCSFFLNGEVMIWVISSAYIMSWLWWRSGCGIGAMYML